MAGGNGLLGRSRRRETQAHCVQVGGRGRRLSHSAPGGLEHRDEGVVESVENLDNRWKEEAWKERKSHKESRAFQRGQESRESKKKRRV